MSLMLFGAFLEDINYWADGSRIVKLVNLDAASRLLHIPLSNARGLCLLASIAATVLSGSDLKAAQDHPPGVNGCWSNSLYNIE